LLSIFVYPYGRGDWLVDAGVAPASVTNMLQKLTALPTPLVEYERHRGRGYRRLEEGAHWKSCVIVSFRQRCAVEKSRRVTARRPMSVHPIARLGRNLARNSDPPPGNETTWRGLTRLVDIQLGVLMGADLVGN